MDALDFLRADQRADFGLGQQRIADLQLAGTLGQRRRQLAYDRPVREHPLHRHADLPGMVEAALGQGRHRLGEIGVGGDDHRRRTAMLQGAAHARRQLRAQLPADPGAADEAEEADARVGHQPLAQLAALDHQRLAPPVRQAGLVQERSEAQTGQRRIGGRLDDDRAAGRDGGSDLVHDQVERVVEGAHRHHHPDRLVLGEGDPARRGAVEAHRHDVAGFRAQQLGAMQHAIDGARHLDPGIDQRLAALVRRLARQSSACACISRPSRAGS